MFEKSLRAIPRAAPALALALCLVFPAWSLAQPPEPALPETTPGPAVLPTAPTTPATPAIPAPPGYGASGAPAEAIRSQELLRFRTMVQGDTGSLERLLGEDLTYTHSTGEVDGKARFLAKLTSGKLRYRALTPSEVEVRMLGEAGAVVTGRIDIQVVSDGKDLAFPARFVSVYARRHGHWLLVAWQSTRLGA
jgi:hypothetical protein